MRSQREEAARRRQTRSVAISAEAADDRTLLSRCAAGDERAFSELTTRHRRLLYGICLRVTGDPHDALDALQETLARVWRGAPGYGGRARVTTWLYRIATNAAITEVHRRTRAPEPIDDDRMTAHATRAVRDSRDGRGTVESGVVDRLAIDAAMRRLPPEYRAAVVLRDLCGCTYDEVADVLDVPLNTVKSRIARGRRALAELLDTSG